MRDIKDVVDNYKDKLSHFLIQLEGNSLHLKCDNYDEKNDWLRAIQFMRDRFQSSCFFSQRKYKERIDDETSIRIQAEIEWKNGDELQVGDSKRRPAWATRPSSRTSSWSTLLRR